MENGVLELLKQLPNLAVAIAALYWGSGIVTKMLEHQQTLIDKLIDMARRNEDLASQIAPPHR